MHSGHFLVYKAFNPLVHTSLTERKYVSIQGEKKKKKKKKTQQQKGCVYQLFLCCTVFFSPFCIVNTTQVSCLCISASLIFPVVVPRPLSCLLQCKGVVLQYLP